MDYQESVRYLLTLGRELAAPQQARVAKFDLHNISLLAERLEHPERTAPCVHIAGTNGKGSTAAMLEAILRAAGYRTGLYTSPHLERINERIRIGGAPISDDDFAAAFTRVQAITEILLASGTLTAHPTFFEMLTAAAFVAFARAQMTFAVFEVGMGGRLDSTNIVAPEVSVITQIDFDHENFLGHSIEEIAGEKAGIIKRGVPVVSAAGRSDARSVIARKCAEMNAPLVDIDAAWRLEAVTHADGRYRATAMDACTGARFDLAPALPGRYQLRNALTAFATARALSDRGFLINDAHIAEGLASVVWPGRLERVCDAPAIYFDGTHNPAGARELAAFWQLHLAGRRIHLVYGAVRDKAVDEVSGLLYPLAANVILTQPSTSRALSALALAGMTEHHAANEVEVIADPIAAFERALELAQPADAVFVTGSLYLAGELRRYFAHRAARHPLTTPAGTSR